VTVNSLDHRIADGSSRAGVLTVLRTRGGLVKVEDLAAAVGLSLSAVRFHLDHLVVNGLVRTTKEPRRSPGRPRVMYQAMPEEAVDDAAAYRRLAALLADELATRGGAAAGEHAGRVWAAAVLPVASQDSQPGRVLPAGAPGSLRDTLVVLENGGFSPRVLDSGWTVELHRCPFVDLMPAQSDVVCAVHRGLLRAVPDGNGGDDQARLYPAPDAEGPCVVRFRR
jgi:predicted ArsR family transcriptional regulator